MERQVGLARAVLAAVVVVTGCGSGSSSGKGGGGAGSCAALLACCAVTSAQLKTACMAAYDSTAPNDLSCASAYQGLQPTYCPAHSDGGSDAGTDAGSADARAASDGPCNPTVTFQWSIEAIQTAQPLTCAAAGAANIVATVNGTPRSFPCPASSSSGTLAVGFGAAGTFTVQLDLVDSAGATLSETPANQLAVGCSPSSVPVVFDAF